MAETSGLTRSRIQEVVIILLLVGSGIGATALLGRNARLSGDLRNRKLDQETMLSEKLLLEKEIARLQTGQEFLKDSAAGLNSQLTKALNNSQAKDRQIAALQKEHEPIDALQRRVHRLETDKWILGQRVTSYEDTLESARHENEDLQSAVAHLREQNRNVATELRAARMLAVNNILVQALTRNGNLTARSRHTKQLSVSVDIASEIANPVFRIRAPDGNTLTPADGTMAISLSGPQKEDANPFLSARKRVDLTFSPARKLEKGIYTIDVLNENKVVGSMQTNLR